MILKALYDYYYRILERNPNSLPIFGFQNTIISFVIVITKDGSFVRIEDCRDNNKKGREYVLPKGTHTNSISPFLFWDNCQYVINYSNANKPLNETERRDAGNVAKWEESLKKAQEKHFAFIEQCKKVWTETQEPEFGAVVRFYETNQASYLKQDILWGEIEKNPVVYVTFRIEGSTRLVPENKSLVRFIEGNCDKQGTCLVTGNSTSIIRKSTPTPLAGCKSSASLVSFQRDSGYDSYGKSQCYNAPISAEAEFAYSTAFLMLKEKKSRNQFLVGNRTFLFWASSNSEAAEQAEEGLFDMFGIAGNNDDNPNAKVNQVRKVFEAIFNEKLPSLTDDRFYILGLASNVGRIAVVYWSETSLKEFAGMILRHFRDMEMNSGNKEEQKPYMGLVHILFAVTNPKKGEKENITPNLPEAIVKSIFQGIPYPFTLFSSCIRRIRAESGNKNDIGGKKKDPVYTVRAAIIKAYLNRLNDNNKKIQPMLDEKNTNPGYLCGRLFAVVERLQQAANNQDSIRSSYMNAASSTPAAVFSTIMKLSNSHYNKLVKDKAGLANYFDNQKKEIVSMLQDFPVTLSLDDQGRFFLGYYHQKNFRKDNEAKEQTND